MAKRYNKEKLIAEYKTGAYTQRELADRFNISVGMVAKLTKDIDKESEQLVNSKIAVDYAMSQKSEQEVNIINEVVNRGLIRRAKAEKIEGHLDTVLGVAVSAGAKILQKDPTMQDIMYYGKFQNDARVGLDLQPKFSTTPSVINSNTNAQQNNSTLSEQEIDDQLAQFEQRG